MPPAPNYNIDEAIKMMNKLFGYDVLGYQKFFATDDAPELCQRNVCFDLACGACQVLMTYLRLTRSTVSSFLMTLASGERI
jgi:hypothetical protein